jgi:hypothetical protein
MYLMDINKIRTKVKYKGNKGSELSHKEVLRFRINDLAMAQDKVQ